MISSTGDRRARGANKQVNADEKGIVSVILASDSNHQVFLNSVYSFVSLFFGILVI